MDQLLGTRLSLDTDRDVVHCLRSGYYSERERGWDILSLVVYETTFKATNTPKKHQMKIIQAW